MADVARVVVELGGWFGAPGANVWHFCAPAHGSISDEIANGYLEDLHTSYAANPMDWAPGVTFTFPPVVPVFDSESGDLLYFVGDAAPQATVTGTGTVGETRACQALLRLSTSDIRNNRLVQGRIFLGPAAGDIIDAAGMISTASRADIEDNFSGIMDPLAGRTVVWSRPTATLPGQVSDVQSISVRNRPGILRGRNK